MIFSSKTFTKENTGGTLLEIGKIIRHPSGRNVKIIKCSFFKNEVNQFHSYFFWREVFEDGSLGKLEHGRAWI